MGKVCIIDILLQKVSFCRVQDIVDQNGLLLLWSDAQEKYSLSNSLILHWQGLLAAEGNGPTANKMNVTAGIAHQILLKNIVKPPTARRSLNNLLRLNSVDWTKVYMLPRQVTIESSLRSFQYKILNNVLYLNEQLFKFKIVASPSCCRVTLTLWKQLRSGTGILLPESMDPQTIILGTWNAKTPDFVIINHIILLFKRYIYLKRQENRCINIFGIKNFIKHIERKNTR